MTERYVATSAAGQHVIRTNNRQTADEYAALMRGEVIDNDHEIGRQGHE